MHRHGSRTAALSTVSALFLVLGGGSAEAVDKPTDPGRLTLFRTAYGLALADEKGNPLYLRKADPPDRPECLGNCARTWPAATGFPGKANGVTGDTAQTPYTAENSRRPHSLFNAHPLYYYKGDRPKKPRGQQVKGFSLVTPDGRPLPTGSGTRNPPGPASKETISATSRPEAEVEREQAKEKRPSPRATTTPQRRPGAKERPPATAKPSARTTTASRPPGASRPVSPAVSASRTASPSVRTSAPASARVPGLVPATPTAPRTPGGGPASAAGTAVSAQASPPVGALVITPSGAARGGADHGTTADVSRPAGPALLSLAVGVSAAAAGAALLAVRRVRGRTTGGRH